MTMHSTTVPREVRQSKHSLTWMMLCPLKPSPKLHIRPALFSLFTTLNSSFPALREARAPRVSAQRHTSSERRNEPTDCGRRSSFAMHERWTSLPSGCALFHLVSFFLSLSWLALSASASLSASANASITACASRSFAASALSLAIMLMLGDASAPERAGGARGPSAATQTTAGWSE